jgi:hypothetical protein
LLKKENMMIMINPILVANDRYSSNKITRNKEQIIGAAMTVEQWSHAQVCKSHSLIKQRVCLLFQRCRFIEKLVPLCSSVQLDMLWTVLQPCLHRDYFYTVQSRYPNYHFKRISTPDSRVLKV